MSQPSQPHSANRRGPPRTDAPFANDTGAAPDLRRKLVRHAIHAVALGVLATTIVVAWSSSAGTLDHLAAFPWWGVPLMLALIALSWCSAAGRLWVMSRALGYRIGYGNCIRVSLCGELCVATTPAASGFPVIYVWLLHRFRVPVATTGSILAAELLVDACVLAATVPLGLWALSESPRYGFLLRLLPSPPAHGAWWAAATVIAIGLARVAVQSGWQSGLTRLRQSTGWHRWRVPARLRLARSRLRHELRTMRWTALFLLRQCRGALALNVVFSITQWTFRYSILVFLVWLFAGIVNPVPIYVTQGAFQVLSAAVVLPGGGGSVELGMPILLKGLIPVSAVGLVIVVWRFFSFHLYILAGGLSLWTLLRRPPKPAKRTTTLASPCEPPDALANEIA